MLSYKVEWHVTGFTFWLSNKISCDGLQLLALCVYIICLCLFFFLAVIYFYFFVFIFHYC